MTRISKSERAAAEKYKLMSPPASPCQNFSDAGLTPAYLDAAETKLNGKPDFLCRQPRTLTTIEHKDGQLNNHRTHESSRAALQAECEYYLRRYFNEPMPHDVLSALLWDAGYYSVIQDAAWNHSLWKLLALQAKHGWRKFIVSFKNNPKPEDAQRYCEAGLIWCTDKTLPQLLMRIELEAHGLSVSFVHRAQKFSFEVSFDDGTATEFDYRAQYLAAVSANEAAEVAAANESEGQLPF
jgi:hypothetical protein